MIIHGRKNDAFAFSDWKWCDLAGLVWHNGRIVRRPHGVFEECFERHPFRWMLRDQAGFHGYLGDRVGNFQRDFAKVVNWREQLGCGQALDGCQLRDSSSGSLKHFICDARDSACGDGEAEAREAVDIINL